MGAVYLCEDLRLPGQQWALKEMILHEPAFAEQVRDSFLREAQFLAGLRHRALPTIVDVFTIESRQYIVMEFIDGETLAQRIEQLGIPEDTLALSWALELAQVLDYLHRQDPPIIFRDLKPENIIITEEGHVKVIDFGLARHFDPGKRRDTQASGTVGYAPPEQWEDSGQSDERSDIYSWAATLYFVLTGKAPSPIYGSNRIRPFRPDIDPGTEALVLRCLKPEPSQRYSSTAELIKDLLILLSEDHHQGTLSQLHPQIGSPSTDPKDRLRPSQTQSALKAPLSYPKQLSTLLLASLLLFLLGAVLPFLKLPMSSMERAAFGNDSIATLLEETDLAKDEAKRLLAEGQYGPAISVLDDLVNRFPQDAEALILKNNAYASLSGLDLYSIPVVSSWHGPEREGFQLLAGYAMAQSQLNVARTNKKPQIYLELHDDRSNGERLLAIAQEVCNDPSKPLLVGPYTSQATRLIAPLVNSKKLPTLTPVASDPQVLSTGRFIHAASDTDEKKVSALAKHLYKTGARKAAVLTNGGSILSRSLAEVFVDSFQTEGGLIASQETHPANQVEFTEQLREARAQGADCIFIAEYRLGPVISVCKTVKSMDWNVRIASQTAGFSDNIFRQGEDVVEGLYLSTYYVPESGGELNAQFTKEFKRLFNGRRPTHREVNSYDLLKVVVAGLDEVGPDRLKLQEYFESLGKDRPAYAGVSGKFTLSKALEARPAHVLRVTQGTYKVVESVK